MAGGSGASVVCDICVPHSRNFEDHHRMPAMSSNGLGILLLIVMFCLVLTMILDPVTLSDRYWKIYMRVMFSLIFGGLIIALAIEATGGQP
jgi:hypothetical protein